MNDSWRSTCGRGEWEPCSLRQSLAIDTEDATKRTRERCKPPLASCINFAAFPPYLLVDLVEQRQRQRVGAVRGRFGIENDRAAPLGDLRTHQDNEAHAAKSCGGTFVSRSQPFAYRMHVCARVMWIVPHGVLTKTRSNDSFRKHKCHHSTLHPHSPDQVCAPSPRRSPSPLQEPQP